MKLSSAIALCLSIALHVVVVAVSSRVTSVSAAEGPGSAPQRDDWAGDTFDLATLLEADRQPPGGDRGPATAPEHPENTERLDPAVVSDDGLPTKPSPSLSSAPPPPAQRPAKTEPSPHASHDAPGPAGDAPTAPSAAASDASAGAGSGQGTGSFGAVGQRGVRNLGAAFARAIPIANSGHPAWQTLPPGPAGVIEVAIAIDESGKIASVKVADADRPPTHMRELVDRTMVMLRAGRFSLSQADVAAGEETLRLSAVISITDAGREQDTPGGAFALGHRRPTREQPGMATFTLTAGRHIEVEVRIVSP